MNNPMNKQNYKHLRKFRSLWLLVLLCLSACSSVQEEPIGIGTGTDDLKQSPCANCEGADHDQEPFYVNGHWMV